MRNVIQLTRWHEFIPFTVPLTLLGGLLAYRFMDGTRLDWRLVIVMGANCLAVAYAFIINDIEDADDDARNPDRARRNVIAAGQLSYRDGWIIAIVTALGAAALYLIAGKWAFINGGAILILAHCIHGSPSGSRRYQW